MSELPRYINPVYSTLVNHLKIEREVAKSKGNVFDSIFPLISGELPIKGEADLPRAVKEFADVEVDGANVHLFALLMSFERRFVPGLSGAKQQEVLRFANQTAESKSIILSRKSLIAFLLNSAGFEKSIDSLNGFLKQKVEQFLEKGMTEKAVEAGYGLPADQLSSFSGFDVEKLRAFDSASRLAKAALLIQKADPNQLPAIVESLESKLDRNYNDWIKPDFWIAIIESEKIVNSNLSADEISYVFEALRGASPDSFRMIDHVSAEGVLVQLGQLISTPRFSPVEDTFCLLALMRAKRKVTIQLSEEEFVELDSKRRDVGRIDPSAVMLLMVSFAILAAAAFFYSGWLTHKYGIGGMLGVIFGQKWSFDTVGEGLSILTSPIIHLLIAFWWIWNIYRHVIRKGTLNIKRILLAFPGLNRLTKEKSK